MFVMSNKFVRYFLVFFIATVCLVPQVNAAQQKPATSQKSKKNQNKNKSTSPKFEVLSVEERAVGSYTTVDKDDKDGIPVHTKIKGIVFIKVKNLHVLQAKYASKDLDVYINNIKINSYGIAGLHTEKSTNLSIKLQRNNDNNNNWLKLLRGFDTLNPIVVITFKVGDKPIIAKEPLKVRLLLASRTSVVLSIILLIFLFGFFFILVNKSNILRRSPPLPLKEGKRRAYSLGRYQMAVWFFLILGSYVLVWAMTGAVPEIPESVLILMGIGSGTALGSGMIQINSDTDPTASQLLQEEKELTSAIEKLKAIKEPNAEQQKELSQKEAELDKVKQKLKDLSKFGESRGFFTDILSGPDGVSFHRFQMFAWTTVLALIFIFSVYQRLSMPIFSNTLLSLMGISSGTYLGFKFPEVNKQKTQS